MASRVIMVTILCVTAVSRDHIYSSLLLANVCYVSSIPALVIRVIDSP